MPINRQHLLLALAWLASVLAVYFFPRPNGSVSTSALNHEAARGARADEGAAWEVSGQDDPETPAQRIRRLVGQARLQASSSSKLALLRMITLLEELDDAEIPAALAEVAVTARDPRQASNLYEYLLSRWAQRDGAAAMAYVDEPGPPPAYVKRSARPSIIRAWAAYDAPHMWEWIRTRHRRVQSFELDPIMTTAFAAMGANDLPFALRCLSEVDTTRIALRWVRQSETFIAEDDAFNGLVESATDDRSRQRLLDAVASLPESRRRRIRRDVLSKWVNADYAAALIWSDQQPAEDRDEYRSIFYWATPSERAVAAVLEKARSSDDPDLRLISRWMESATYSFDPWLARQPPDPLLDSFRVSRARGVMAAEPTTAAAWASKVQDEKLRGELLQEIQKSRESPPSALPPP